MDTPSTPGSAPARSAPQPSPTEGSAPVRVTFVTWDAETDGVAVLHDGVEVWRESSFDSLSQYLQIAPLGVPVVIDVIVRD